MKVDELIDRKLRNLRLVERQKKARDIVLTGHPLWLTMDPSSICHLQCPSCPTGRRLGVRRQALLPYRRFESIMRVLGPYLWHIDFCNWGEPLLNPELAAMMRCARSYGIDGKVDTNLSVELSDIQIRELVGAGFSTISVSLDGASEQAYSEYRRGGDFGLVVSNLRRLVAEKKRTGGLFPRIQWQFLVFRHNEHEIPKARAMAQEIGVDFIGFTAPFCPRDWVSTIDEYNNYTVKQDRTEFRHASGDCNWLWDAITINADCSVSPCCSVEDQADDFGTWYGQPFFLLWNNLKFMQARRHIRAMKGPAARGSICRRCDHAGASNHRELNDHELKEMAARVLRSAAQGQP